MNKLILILLMLTFSGLSNAAVNIYTQHQVVGMFQHGVNRYQDVQFPTGDIPYIGNLGVEYVRKNFSYTVSYIHRSNADLVNQDEYNYNGVALGIKYSYCVYKC